jgi:prepilin-type N-terminal cleavage/methylation domain-containing protein
LKLRGGLTLIELLLTLAVLGILAAILIPQLSGDLPERLSAAAQIVSADLDYARSLAVANNSSYRITFDPANNRYYLKHSGTNAQFNTLPQSPYRQSDDPADQQTTNLSMLPLPEPGVRLIAAVQMQGTAQAATSVEFNPLGGTTSTYQTVLWLSCGGGLLQRYNSIQVDPVTGLVSIGPTVTALPSGITPIAQQSQAVQTGS